MLDNQQRRGSGRYMVLLSIISTGTLNSDFRCLARMVIFGTLFLGHRETHSIGMCVIELTRRCPQVTSSFWETKYAIRTGIFWLVPPWSLSSFWGLGTEIFAVKVFENFVWRKRCRLDRERTIGLKNEEHWKHRQDWAAATRSTIISLT